MAWMPKLPEDLAQRLSRSEDRLLEALEIGLEVLEDERGVAREGEDLPGSWRCALLDLHQARQQEPGSSAPTTEELLAYLQVDLEPADREAFLDRLMAYPESVRDLVDLVSMKGGDLGTVLEAEETNSALQEFRSRVLAEKSLLHPNRSSDQSRAFGVDTEDRNEGASSEGITRPSKETPGRVPTSSGLRWPAAIAALLIATLGSLWLFSSWGDSREIRSLSVIDISASRGARVFAVPESSEDVLLLFPFEPEAVGVGSGQLTIMKTNGDIIYHGSFKAPAEGSRLSLTLPRGHLQPGLYQVEIETPSSGATGAVTRELRFAISD